jgi:hypothetical protein
MLRPFILFLTAIALHSPGFAESPSKKSTDGPSNNQRKGDIPDREIQVAGGGLRAQDHMSTEGGKKDMSSYGVGVSAAQFRAGQRRYSRLEADLGLSPVGYLRGFSGTGSYSMGVKSGDECGGFVGGLAGIELTGYMNHPETFTAAKIRPIGGGVEAGGMCVVDGWIFQGGGSYTAALSGLDSRLQPEPDSFALARTATGFVKMAAREKSLKLHGSIEMSRTDIAGSHDWGGKASIHVNAFKYLDSAIWISGRESKPNFPGEGPREAITDVVVGLQAGGALP